MPIDPIHLQRRHAEVGRIRLGQKGDRGQPQRLQSFRFTSPNPIPIEAIATLYGGTARPWRNGTIDEHEVVTDATEIPVYVLKGAFSQWFEFWTAGGCKHRCTGVEDHTDPRDVKPCDESDPNHLAAVEKPTTRLSVMLTELDSLGAWRLESHGWNAASELPNMAELAAAVGDLVPAKLFLATRRSVVQVKGKPQTSIYVVPGLDLLVSKARLAEIAGAVGGGAAAIDGPASGMRPAAEIAAAPAFDEDDATDALADCLTVDEVSALWRRLGAHGMLTDEWKARLTARAQEIDPPAEQPAPAEPEALPLDEPVDAEVVDDDPLEADAAWQRLIAAAGAPPHGLTSSQIMAAWGEWSGGKPTEQGTAADFDRMRTERFS